MNKKLWIIFGIRITLGCLFLYYLNHIGITWHELSFWIILLWTAFVSILSNAFTREHMKLNSSYNLVHCNEIRHAVPINLEGKDHE